MRDFEFAPPMVLKRRIRIVFHLGPDKVIDNLKGFDIDQIGGSITIELNDGTSITYNKGDAKEIVLETVDPMEEAGYSTDD